MYILVNTNYNSPATALRTVGTNNANTSIIIIIVDIIFCVFLLLKFTLSPLLYTRMKGCAFICQLYYYV